MLRTATGAACIRWEIIVFSEDVIGRRMGVGVPRVVKTSRDVIVRLGSKKKSVSGGPGSSRSSWAGKWRGPSFIEDVIDTHTAVGVPRDGGRGVQRQMGRRRQLMYMRREIYIESRKQKNAEAE